MPSEEDWSVGREARAEILERTFRPSSARPPVASQRVMTRLGMSRPMSSLIKPLLTVIWLTE